MAIADLPSTEPLSDQQRDILLAVVALRDADPLGEDIHQMVSTRRESINRSYVYQVLRKFEDRDFVDATRHDDDGRANVYQPTVWGIELVKDYRDEMDLALDGNDTVDDLDPDPTQPEPTDTDSYVPSSAPWARAARAQGAAKDIRDFLGTESGQSISIDNAVKLTETTEGLVRKAVDTRSDWFDVDGDVIHLTDAGQQAADDSPFNNLNLIE